MKTIFSSLFFVISTSYAAKPTPKVEQKPQVIVQEVKPVVDLKKLLYPAQIQAQMYSTITADLDSYVKKVNKTIGSHVKAGEIVLYLENADPAYTYAPVPVRSIINGVLSQFNVQSMSKVSKGEKLFSVMNADTLKILAEIPASEINKLQIGQQGAFYVGSRENGSLPVKIVGISPVVDPRSGTASAEMEFVTEDKNYKLQAPVVGTVGQISFELNYGQVILIPENAIGYVEGKPHVRIVHANLKTQRLPVELGEQRESMFVVKSGVKLGDKIVLRSNKTIKENEVVEIQTPEAKETK